MTALSLKAMCYHCPGLGGKNQQYISRTTFDAVLSQRGRIVIPLFQRRYCWDEARVRGWWADVVAGRRDHLGVHNSGNVVVVPGFDAGELICIDGQQRITTTLLLVAAIRDAAVNTSGCDAQNDLNYLIRRLESILYTDPVSKSDAELDEGKDVSFCKLAPSFLDRKPFFSLILEGAHSAIVAESASPQARAKSIFDSLIKSHLDEIGSASPNSRMRELETLADLALTKMGLTLVEISRDVNLSQVYLWLQEKTVFGEGSLLYNPSPGVAMTAADLVRNLLVSAVAHRSLAEQERFHETLWLVPIERRCPSPADLGSCLAHFIEKTRGAASDEELHISALETAARKALGKRGKRRRDGRSGEEDAMVYAKFYSLYEGRMKNKQGEEVVKVATELLEELALYVQDHAQDANRKPCAVSSKPRPAL